MSQLKKNDGDFATTTTTSDTSSMTTATAPAAPHTKKSSAEKVVDRFLEQQKNTKQRPVIFPDLLAHLMGMGDATFWANGIIGHVIPFLESEAPENYQWVEHLEEGPLSAKFCDLDSLAKRLSATEKPNFQSKLEEQERDSELDFTFDVVYSVQTLCKGLGIVDPAVDKYAFDKVNKYDFDKADRDRMQQQVLSKLSFHGDGNDHFKFFLIFNAREQRFEQRYGITNTSLLRSCSSPDVVRSFFQISWEQTSVNGGIKFTPEFYQQWMCMKVEMYSQYPIILDVLIQCMLDRYVKVGVNYAEFSVGVKDLVVRPWIFVHLSRPNAPTQFGEFQVPRILPTITFRYLAAFNRCDVNEKCYLNEVGDNAAEMAGSMAEVFDEISGVKPAYFRNHLGTLADIKRKFKESRDCNNHHIVSPLHEMCVGLDYIGDERSLPHCSFAHRDFITFLWDERKKRNGHFGFRIHAGEVPIVNELFQTVHMGVVSTVICRILGQYCALWKQHHPIMPEVPPDCPPPLRIAHGMGFLKFAKQTGVAESRGVCPTTVPNTVDQFRTRIHFALSELRRLRIPFEINPSGSKYLYGTRNAVSKMIFTFLNNEFRVVVGSGNDGVCPTRLGNYRSVAAELIRVVRNFDPGFFLQRNNVKALLKCYRFAAFGQRNAVNSSPKEAKKPKEVGGDHSLHKHNGRATVTLPDCDSDIVSEDSEQSEALKPIAKNPSSRYNDSINEPANCVEESVPDTASGV